MRTLATAVILFVAAAASARQPDDVSILRDRWGVACSVVGSIQPGRLEASKLKIDPA